MMNAAIIAHGMFMHALSLSATRLMYSDVELHRKLVDTENSSMLDDDNPTWIFIKITVKYEMQP